MPPAPSLLTPADRDAVARRISAVVRAVIRARTGGRIGGQRDELRELAAECGCSYATMARLYGWHGYLSDSTRGRARTATSEYHKASLTRLDVLMRLCQVARVSADWVLFGTGTAPAWWLSKAREAA